MNSEQYNCSQGNSETTEVLNPNFGVQMPHFFPLFPPFTPSFQQQNMCSWYCDLLKNAQGFPMATKSYSNVLPLPPYPQILPNLLPAPPPAPVALPCMEPMDLYFEQPLDPGITAIAQQVLVDQSGPTQENLQNKQEPLHLGKAENPNDPFTVLNAKMDAPTSSIMETMATFHTNTKTPEAIAQQHLLDLLFGGKKERLCRKCKCHGLEVPLKSHKGLCPYDPCTCDKGCKRLQKERITRNAANKARREGIQNRGAMKN